MSAYVIFDVEIRDMTRYQEFMKGVKPALDAAGARYLARGGAHRVYEGDWCATNAARPGWCRWKALILRNSGAIGDLSGEVA